MRAIYLAGPMAGCTDEQATGWRELFKVVLGKQYDLLDPVRRGFLHDDDPGNWTEIVALDKQDIDDCDIVVANVWKPSHGTSMEIIYAHERQKYVIAICPHTPSPWVLLHSHVVVKDVSAALTLLQSTEVALPKHQDYTLGFMFDVNTGHVALIRKARPEWQAGKLNGIGGHKEYGESPKECQVREFREETGKVTTPEDWRLYCTLQGKNKSGRTYRVFCYWSMGDLSDLQTMTDEQIVTLNPLLFDHAIALDNVPWLMQMAIFDGHQHHYLESMENRRTQ